LLTQASQLLNDEEAAELEQQIAKVEMLVNGVERFVEFDENGDVVIMERSAGKYTLYDIEMAFESNPDYYAYFERPDGVKVTKFDVERELEKVRKWVFSKVRERASNMRFSRMV
jgi:hypothetical protein